MSGADEETPFTFDVTAYQGEWAYLWRQRFLPSTGVTTWDFTVDLKNIVGMTGGGGVLELLPALQFAPTRVDRPDDGIRVSGTPVGAVGPVKFQESPTGLGSQFFWRSGIAYRCSSGTFVRAQGHLYTSYRTLGRTFAAEEIVFNPLNDNTDWSVFPLNGGKPIPVLGVDKAKLVVLGLYNTTATLEWQLHARFYNDPFDRGNWLPFGTAATPAAGKIDTFTGEVPFTGVTKANYQWLDLGFGIRKSGGNASRCVFHVIPALTMP